MSFKKRLRVDIQLFVYEPDQRISAICLWLEENESVYTAYISGYCWCRISAEYWWAANISRILSAQCPEIVDAESAIHKASAIQDGPSLAGAIFYPLFCIRNCEWRESADIRIKCNSASYLMASTNYHPVHFNDCQAFCILILTLFVGKAFLILTFATAGINFYGSGVCSDIWWVEERRIYEDNRGSLNGCKATKIHTQSQAVNIGAYAFKGLLLIVLFLCKAVKV